MPRPSYEKHFGPLDAPCPNTENHTPCPTGYVAWHEWAAEKAKTHDQETCPECGLYSIWRPREEASA